ncbi:hypothetical protein NKDENANG_03265 [Candidatus Entotheonellaceae bacterium PAL068K]
MAARQKDKCPICSDSLHNGEEIHSHHVVPKSNGGKDTLSNLILVHLYCHQQIHKGKDKGLSGYVGRMMAGKLVKA